MPAAGTEVPAAASRAIPIDPAQRPPHPFTDALPPLSPRRRAAAPRPELAASPREPAFLDVLARWVERAEPAARRDRQRVAHKIRKARAEGSWMLQLQGHGLTALPDCLHQLGALECLDVSGGNPANRNRFCTLPRLTPALQTLIAENIDLLRMPSLPESLRTLRADNNCLARLPALPPGMKILSVNNNLLTELPQLPASLGELHAGGNRLKRLPQLPTEMQILSIDYNELQELPNVPMTLARPDAMIDYAENPGQQRMREQLAARWHGTDSD